MNAGVLVRHGPVHVMVAAEVPALSPEALSDVVRAFDTSLLSLTVTGVAARDGWWSHAAPLSGRTTLSAIRTEHLDAAAACARAAALSMPAAVTVRWSAATSWRAALRMASDADALVVLGGRPGGPRVGRLVSAYEALRDRVSGRPGRAPARPPCRWLPPRAS